MTLAMSAFAVAIGGKADMPFCTAYVRLWPKADIAGLPACQLEAIRLPGPELAGGNETT
jgi:hypothetical protein